MKDRFSPDFSVAGQTDVGRKRDHNEDAFCIENELGLLVVADGMGGHAAGEVASGIAVETVPDFIYECDPELFKAPDSIEVEGLAKIDTDATMAEEIDSDAVLSAKIVAAAVINANKRINDENLVRGMKEGHGMGTTIVGMWLLEDTSKAAVFHVGDSRLYRLRGNKLIQITKDHSLYQEWLNRGAEGEPPKSNIILRALGPYDEVEPEVSIQELKSGDVFMICSDGLTDLVNDEDIAEVLKELDSNTLDDGCSKLIDMANEKGGKDNITVVMTCYK
ncbi:MAG: serine/threonine-protein phosphatase [Alphaproteobacteria bacterium]|nr:serine/threonine-protein phosphatase [Alphaproteobacteria bacterium]